MVANSSAPGKNHTGITLQEYIKMISNKTQINISLSLGLLLLAAGAASAMASDSNADYIEACKSELRQQYGNQMDITLIKKRRIYSGVQVQLAARIDENNSEFVTCWVPNDETDDGRYSGGYNTAAVTLAPAPPALY
jgi:hypothetical protein